MSSIRTQPRRLIAGLIFAGLLFADQVIGGLLGAGPVYAQTGDSLSQPASFHSRYTPTAPTSSTAQATDEPLADASTTEATEAPLARAKKPIPLAPPSERTQRELTSPRMPNTSNTIATILGSLAVVLGLFFATAWFLRRNMPKGMTLLPGEVLEQLGRAPLAGKQQMYLVRVGHKLLLLVVTPHGAETLTEITDPDEVDRFCGLCRQNAPHGPSAEFRAVLRQFEREPAGPGFLGETNRSDAELAAAGRTTGRTRTRGTFDA